jgi:RNA polymerase sigma factor (sigma-70 family)
VAESFDVLVPRALDGDRDAWNGLVDRLQGVAWHAIGGFDLRTEDRKDAFAATFFRLHERLSTVREPQKLPGWVATTARNEVRTLLRARRRLVPSDPADLAVPPDPSSGDDPVIEAELVGAVHRAFATLSARCQELLRLATLDPPLSYAEIGEALDMPHGSIGPTRQRCLDQLRRSAALAPFVTGAGR